MLKYYLEFVLNANGISCETLKDYLKELGEDLEVRPEGEDFKIHICTGDPTIIFDTCAQLGRIRSVKIEER